MTTAAKRRRRRKGGRPRKEGAIRTASGIISRAGKVTADLADTRALLRNLRQEEAEGKLTRQYLLLENGRFYGGQQCVYFVRMGATEAIKIGSAQVLKSRIADLQVGSPVTVKMFGFVNFTDRKSAYKAETYARNFAQKLGAPKLQGEWLRLTDLQANDTISALTYQFKDSVVGYYSPQDAATVEKFCA
jgi:hypothetical protein